MTILNACTSKTSGLEIDYKEINCAGWPEPIQLSQTTDIEDLRKLTPLYIKLQECMDYRKSRIISVEKNSDRYSPKK